MPEDLKKNIEFRFSPLIVEKYNGTLMSFYKDLEILNYDFIYEVFFFKID